MAIRQPLFQQNDTTEQSADVFRMWLRDLVADRPGIMQETAFSVIQRGAGANNSVDVQAGGIIIPGSESGTQGAYYVNNDATLNVPMSVGAHGSLPRIDTVLVDVRDSFYSGVNNDARIVYQAGTAASTPSPPDLAALGYKNFWRLGNINVPANDNTIITSDITDLRTSTTVTPAQGRACGIGGVINCTSTARPSLPRQGQMIWESDTRRILINEGTAIAPTWTAYASYASGLGPWTVYTPTFLSVTLGTGGTKYGRYFVYGKLVLGVAGFKLGTSGAVTGQITVSIPVNATTAGGSNMRYVCGGRGVDASTGFIHSATGEIAPTSFNNLAFNFATQGQSPWGSGVPFPWAINDSFNCFLLYEID